MEAKCYSYIRFSSAGQEDGDSIRRQTYPLEKIAAKLGLPLDDTLRMTDKGLSGYFGDNLTKGALGEFMKLVDANKIAVGSILILENLDRLTRLPLIDAQYLFAGILMRGIGIYTTMDNRLITKENYNVSDSIVSTFSLNLGHEESAKRSVRLREANANKRVLARKGEYKLSRGCPLWLEPDGIQASPTKFITTGYKPKPEVVEVIKLIFQMKLDGKGSDRIAQELNRRNDIWKPPGKKDKVTGIRKYSKFNTSYIDLLLRNRAVIGELQLYRFTKDVLGHRVNIPDGNPIPDYYPAIIDVDTFNRVKKLIDDNAKHDGRGGGRGDKVNNLFSHMAVCGKCGNAMRYVNHGNESLWFNHLKCSKVLQGFKCDNGKLYYYEVENAVLKYCIGLKPEDVLPDSVNTQSELSVLQNQLQAKDGELGDITEEMEAIENTKLVSKGTAFLQALDHRYSAFDSKKKKLTSERKDITRRITELSISGKEAEDQIQSIKELIELMNSLDGQERITLRLSLRNQLRRLIKYIKVYSTKKQVAIFFQSGERRLVNMESGESYTAYPPSIFGKR